jgi:hypothetical protein
MMSLFMIIAGVLALWFAIKGSAPGFKNDYPKEMKEDADKMLRKFCWIIGPVAIITGVLQMIYPEEVWVYWVSLAIIVPAITVYVILFRKKFKKHLKKMK